MPLNLLALLQGASPQTQTPEDDILVQAASPSFQENDPAPPPLGNRSFVEEAQQALGTLPQRRGLFGTRGTLRDVLGTVGDAFLLQAGRNPLYAPQRQRERVADALTGFTANPLAAVERLSQVDPEAASQLFETVAQQNARQRQLEQQALEAQSKLGATQGKEGDVRYQDYADRFSSLLGSATPETYDKIKPLLQVYKTRGGLGDEFPIPDSFDEGLSRTLLRGANTAPQLLSDEDRDAARAIQQFNAESQRISATRPRAAPAGRAPTKASQADPILKRILQGEKITPAEQEVLERTGFGRSKSGSRLGGRRSTSDVPAQFKRSN